MFFSRIFDFKSLTRKFLASLSSIWVVFTPLKQLDLIKIESGWAIYVLLIITALLAALIWNWPRSKIKRRFNHNDLTIRVINGDVLKAGNNIVIGFSDTFDTEIGAIIRGNSLQGQFQKNVYAGNVAALNTDLDTALAPHKNSLAIFDPDKVTGKSLRFPIGTAVTLDKGKRYFLLVYTKMGNDLACIPTPAEEIVFSLYKLWDSVRRFGQHEPVSIPVIASDLARSGLSRTMLIKMIILTFYTAHVKQAVTKGLDIYVHPSDIEHVDFNAIGAFLKTM